MAKAGRPKGKIPSYAELGLRATVSEAELIQQATEKDAARRNVPISRNNFCLRAAIAAAKKELGIVDLDRILEQYPKSDDDTDED